MIIRGEILDYDIIMDDIGALGGLAEDNIDFIYSAIDDVNRILKAGLHHLSIDDLECNSRTVKLIIDNISRNGERLTDDRVNDANIYGAKLMVAVLGELMVSCQDFYVYQIDPDETDVREITFGTYRCTFRMEVYQAYQLDEDETADAVRLVKAAYSMFVLKGEKSRGVVRELQALFRAH